MQKTRTIKKEENKQNWYVIDVSGKNLGKISVRVAGLLLGKGKVTYAPNLYSGDNVIVINASKVDISEKKYVSKKYYEHSGFPGGLKTKTYEQMLRKNPTVIIKNAVKGMLPKTKLGRDMLTHLYIYQDETHPHEAQKPTTIS